MAKNPLKSAKSSRESVDRAQPSPEDGVPEDMATLVLDNPALGQRTALQPDSKPDPDRGINYAEDPNPATRP